MKGDFLRNETGRVVPMHLIEAAIARWATAPDDGPLSIGYDPAGPGDGGHGSLPRLPLLLGDVLPRQHRDGKGTAVGFIGNLREALNKGGHLSIMPASAAVSTGERGCYARQAAFPRPWRSGHDWPEHMP